MTVSERAALVEGIGELLGDPLAAKHPMRKRESPFVAEVLRPAKH